MSTYIYDSSLHDTGSEIRHHIIIILYYLPIMDTIGTNINVQLCDFVIMHEAWAGFLSQRKLMHYGFL